ncbi:ligand-binding sensor domain-containing protein [Colwellia sp. TT2012]|uniref:ligand-binding sensor domain-containing protein n=1 Tax=Colwellia sp. TT2012 TaxID=1720342 RepID=UPI00070D1DD7|nr:ligand-binding sensor domain-containing diguanylate cyclase [Colwellia sp. TT2012]
MSNAFSNALTLSNKPFINWLNSFALLKFIWTNLLTVFILLSVSTTTLAQRGHLHFNNYVNELAIPNTFVLKVLQDKHGYIWTATQNGLYRFDGHQYKEFVHLPLDNTTLPNNYVNAIFFDKSGGMWVGTDGGLSRYDEEKEAFHTYAHNPHDINSLSRDVVMSIIEAQDGVLWLGTWGGGLNSFNPKTAQFNHFKNIPQDPNSLSDDLVYTVIEDNSGVIWVGTRNGGLNQFDKETGNFKHYQHNEDNPNSLSNNKVYTIFEDSNETLWVGTRGGGLNKFNRDSQTFEHFRHNKEQNTSISSDEIFAIFEDKLGSLWVGTHKGGLNLFDPKKKHFEHYLHNYEDDNSISSNNIWSIIQDKNGFIWLGTFGEGITQFSPDIKKFGRVSYDKNNPAGLAKGYLRALFVDKSGTTWIGMQSGLYSLDSITKQFILFTHDPDNPMSLSNNYIKAIFEDSRGNLWIGTSNGLNLLNKKDNSFTRFYHHAEDSSSLSDSFIVTIHEDSKGLLWVGTQHGLNRKADNSNKFSRFLHDLDDVNSISHNSINTLMNSHDGSLWIGTSGGGLNKFNHNSQQFSRYQNSADDVNSLSNNIVYSLALDSKDILWIGTESGLNKFDIISEKFTHYREKDGLITDRILAVMVDRNDKVWLGELGISLFDPVSEKFSNFVGASAGCAGASQGAYHQSDDGKIFFGIENYCAFYPENIVLDSTPPTVFFTDFLMLNQSVKITEQGILTKAINHTKAITLSHKDNVFSFKFSVLDFLNSSESLFQYHLEGFNESWIETDSDHRTATYTNLPAGKYTFQVKARNGQGVWNHQGRSIDIIIEPAPWRTWWAYSLYVLIVLAIVGGGVRLQLQKIMLVRVSNVKLERKVLARTKELNEKNESLNQALMRLEEITLTDQLTNAHNRRFMSQFIDQEIAQLQREHFDHKYTNLGFIMIDADHFKSVNDNFGHEAGDIVLIRLVELLKSSCRALDWVIRWGGEEFVIVTRFNKQVELQLLAERIRKNIENFEFDLENGHKINMTCSMGLTSFPFIRKQIDAYTWQQTMNLADIALYEAKNNGRNTWVSLFEKNIENPELFYLQSSVDLQAQVEQGVIYYKKPSDNK